MKIKKVYDNGSIFEPNVLNISNADVLKSFSHAISNIAALSLGAAYATKASVPHIILNSFKNLASVTFETDYSFP